MKFRIISPPIYIRIGDDVILVKELSSEKKPVEVVRSQPVPGFYHPRTIVGDFEKAHESAASLLRELRRKIDSLALIKPVLIIHVTRFTADITQPELRVVREVFASSKLGRRIFFYDGPKEPSLIEFQSMRDRFKFW